MGSKGQTTTSNTTQNQTYTPAGGSYITNALNQAQNLGGQSNVIPQAPVAGFSQDQQTAFGNVNAAQGMAQPYINQAQGYFGPGGAQQFYNPMAANVTANLNDIFGQQQAQTTGQLTQAAGGVGADRIAVGQANLAKEQGLAAGQTYSQLWNNAVQQAQGAGYGTAALGSQAQNAALQGAQAQLGTGGLQQQLSQAQMNAPYQQQLAQQQLPYQQASWLSNIVGSLAPGLGGSTYGTGSNSQTAPGPSIWSQLLGGGAAAAGIYGGFNGGSGGKGSGNALATGSAIPGASGPTSVNGAPLNNSTYDEGGSVPDDPINVGAHPFFPTQQIAKIDPHIPQLNLNPPQQQQQQQSGGGGGGGVGDLIKIAGMFLARGGAAKGPYDFHEHRFPQGYAEGGSPDDVLDLEDRFAPVKEALTNGDFDAMGRNSTTFEPFKPPTRGLPPLITKGATTGAAPAPARTPARAMKFGPEEGADEGAIAPPAAAPSRIAAALAPPAASPGATRPAKDDSFVNSPWAALTAAGLGIMGGTSPFAGVNIGQGAQQGLKMLQTQRENAQKDTTVQQAADRLDQEARFHEMQYTRIPLLNQKQLERQKSQDDLARDRFDRPYNQLTAMEKAQVDRQKAQDDLAHERFERPYKDLTKHEQAQVDDQQKRTALEAAKPFTIGIDRSGYEVKGVRDPANPGRYLDAAGQPIDPARLRTAPAQAGASPEADGVIPAHAATLAAGAYNYAEGAPTLEKGMDVPAPGAVGNHSPRSMQDDAEYYLQTGKLPPGPRGGKSPTAIQQNDYVNAVRNYAGALAASRGVTPEQAAEMRRTSPGTLRFVLGQDGRATVSLGTAVRHLDTLRQLSAAWNAGDIQKINQLRATMAREFGNAAGTNLESAAGLIGPEIIKALGVAGAGTNQERDHAGAQFSTARSPAQLIGAIDTTQKLLGGQLEGKMRQAAAAGVSTEKFKGLIGERPFEILQQADKAGAPPAATLPDAAKAQLKEGQVTTFGNGQKWTLQNGQPKQVP